MTRKTTAEIISARRKALGLEDDDSRLTTIDFALDGDWGPLCARLRNPKAPLTLRERNFIADEIDPKKKRPHVPHRVMSWRIIDRQKLIAMFVADCQSGGEVMDEDGKPYYEPGVARKVAIGYAMKEFGCSERTVENALSAHHTRRRNARRK